MSAPKVTVQQVMTHRFVALDGIATVAEGVRQLREAGADALIINKRDSHDEYGLVLLSDIGKQVVARDRAADRVNLYEVMTKPVVSVSPQMDIRYCARLFERFSINQAPVEEAGAIVGLVSYRDLVLRGLE
ncbi:putative signal transduction protein with CBS domains [Ferrimonas balearica DSM 9799]|uniref:Putative signal transduction protein with CBS domains n=1 Tax=Ferrimonas balearica (strain DSM 9799 / CCM 4581 / KCTC 23876 / PAT) TaxID=550540 RepID=E1SPE1_FERBD|nr:CBS domain-containing protein [Ferrimonas balearica]ADN76758.1 putative signal transduction protein with CBS domains [Ferrimonas balearica DSM 9799]MBW3140255.1 CBS domain-containing protein [Ferrimonas balearica]MBW3166265.1 CBS domain-containing protein [Ferrimonas balearica]MBY5979861.1 CBS domain-containing protein [Ferrimonas balearica]MBY6106636.1 CBS domain-containing protein [Ferrimonas balearica]